MALSSAASTRTPTSTARNPFEPRSGGGDNSCYFPGCRKDANCNCEICIESFNATRDLHSALRFPPKKRKKNPPPSPASDPHTPPSTPDPVSSISTIPRTPLPAKPTPNSRPNIPKSIKKEEERRIGGGYKVSLVLAVVFALLAVDSGMLATILKGFGPKIGTERTRGFAEEARVSEKGLKGRLRFLERKVEGVVGDGKGGIFNCSSLDSGWKLNHQEGHHLFLQWRCVIYQSMAEELSVWGSQLQSSGILAAGVSARSLTLLSGRITEWSEEKPVPTARASNGSSWTLGKWSSAALQLEGETWVLEYRKSAVFQGPGLVQSAWRVLGVKLQRMVRELRWRMLEGGRLERSHYQRRSRGKQQFEHPT